MKFSSFYLILIFAVLTNAQELSDEEIEQILSADPVCDQNKTIQCGRSCGEYYVCKRGIKFPLSISRCPLDRPFCTIGSYVDSCHVQRDLSRPTCIPLPFLFQCTDAGYFPDPTDCSSYYICEPFMDRFNPTRKTCPDGLIYDPRSRRCFVMSTTYPCRTITCENGTSSFQAYPGNPQYFYNCVERSVTVPSGKIPVLYRCPGIATGNTAVAFNPNLNKCVYNCGGSSSGRVWVPDAAREFYQCNYGQQALLERCPRDFTFNAQNSQCVIS
uniref:CSON010835 protein n=1 Tax=Culicoides sonorensis TaxID=179676 RepID=A0A336M7V1_CULSO